MKTIACVLMLLGVLVGESWSHDVINRWRRQAAHPCQPDDAACQKCNSCSSVETSDLPECCEAYNACCDNYFQACKQCTSIKSEDQYFPEYCCASFTDCCDHITTFTTQVKPPAPVRTKPKLDLVIPEVPAPKPTTFPGAKAVSAATPETNQPFKNTFQDEEFAPKPSFTPQAPAFRPEESVFAPPSPAIPPQVSDPRQPKPSFAVESPVGVAPVVVDNSQRQRTRTQARAQGRPQSRGRQGNRRRQQGGINLADRSGRVTSRGRVTA